MKKYLMTVVAALAAASFTSCSNEMDMFDPISSDMATIDLNVTNDNVMVTRASSAISANDYANWFFQVSPKTVTINEKTTNAGETVATGFKAASTIGDYKFKAGGYSVEVRNYATESDAYKANSNKGDAFYTGSVDKALAKGNNAVEVDCGQAQNCRVKVNLTGLNDLSAISDPSITLTQSERGVACPALGNGETGYFMVGKAISYVLNYKYTAPGAQNATDKSTTSVNIPNPSAHTEYSIIAATNSNGTITLTIKRDDTFGDGDDYTITIDAATGAEANQ